MRHIRQWPCIRGAPAFGARKNVTETRSRQDTGILSLEPVVEPCERLDVQAFPRPRQTVLAQHGDLNVFAVGEFLECRKGGWKMQRHVLPVATEIDRHLYLVQQRQDVAIVPPCVPQWMFHDDGAPEVVPRMRIVMKLEKNFQPRHRRLAIEGGKLPVNSRLP